MRDKAKAQGNLKRTIAELGLLYNQLPAGEDHYVKAVEHYLFNLTLPNTRITAKEYDTISALIETIVFKLMNISQVKTREQMRKEVEMRIADYPY